MYFDYSGRDNIPSQNVVFGIYTFKPPYSEHPALRKLLNI